MNADDGAKQYLTWTLFDLFTIQETHGRLDHLSVAMVGALKYGRTVHSLTQALAKFDDNFYFRCWRCLPAPCTSMAGCSTMTAAQPIVGAALPMLFASSPAQCGPIAACDSLTRIMTTGDDTEQQGGITYDSMIINYKSKRYAAARSSTISRRR
ncbi:MAG: Aspartate carbamoyltransferase [Sodalis sp.]|nr:MAG: Aspartate carbamoyltransferase [Sodalis sp.]